MAKWWEYWIPGYGMYIATKDYIQNPKDPYAWVSHAFGQQSRQEKSANQEVNELSNILQGVEQASVNDRQEFLADREHTEQREDTAYQRAVADMQKAGLNPYTVGANASPSSSSSVGENTIGTKLQMLGYVLDLKNLSLKNKQVTNQAIGNLLKLVK